MAVDPAGTGNPGRTFITNPVFMSAFFPGEALTFTYTGSAGATYYVTDYYGNIVVTERALPASPFTVPTLPLGWYKIYLKRAVFTNIPWGPAAGEKTFCIVRSNSNYPRPGSPTIIAANRGDEFSFHIPARAFFGVGPVRHQIQDLNSTSQHAGLALDVTYEVTQRVADSVRPQTPFISFPNGYTGTQLVAAVQAACNAPSTPSTVWIEGSNEPNIGNAAATIATSVNTFADAVHAAHAKARVLAPSSLSNYGDAVSDSGAVLRWQKDFWAALAGNASKVDGISFHNYDNPGGVIASQRKIFDKWVAMLTSFGIQNKPRWNTEFGSIWGVAAGVFMPRQQARLTLLELQLHEQYLIPKERTSFFYDRSHGFWDFPSFWIMCENADYNITPTGPLMRVWAEELFGKAYSASLDFGSENDVYIGSRFLAGDGSSVYTIQSTSGHIGQVTWNVTGAPANIVKCDPWGNLTNVPVVSGQVVISANELVTYLRAPNGVTLTPVAINYGIKVDKAVLPTFTSTTSNPNTAGQVISGDMSGTPVGDWTPGDTYRNDWVSATNPQVTWQEDFSRSAFVNKIVVTCPFPANGICTFIKFDIQGKGAITPGVWTTIASFDETVNANNQIIHTSGNESGGCYVDTYYSFRNQWVYRADPALQLDGVRIVVSKTTYGQRPTPETWNRQYLVLTGSPTGGTFTLTWNGSTSAPIPYNSTPDQILAILQAMPGGSTWKSTILGSDLVKGVTLVADRVWPLTANSAGLTGGSSPTVTVSRPSGTAVGGDMFLSGPPIPQLRQVQVYLNEYDLGKGPNSPLYPAI